MYVVVAEEYLSFAFAHCHRQSKKNKRMILIYLIPVKMLLVCSVHTFSFVLTWSLSVQSLAVFPLQGTMPKDDVLHKYNLMEFADVTQAVRFVNMTH